MAFRKKAAQILALEPDLLIVPECECPERLEFAPSVQPPRDHLWIGDNPTKGIGIFSYSDLALTLHELYDPTLRYVIPIKVSGRMHFNLLAIWAMDDKEDFGRNYIGQVWLAVNQYEALLDNSVLIVGDFNWNTIWDHSSRDLYGNLTQTVEFLTSKGVISLYHSFFREEFGQETCPTLYMYRWSNKPYHVDYLFASMDFVNRLQSVEIGVYEDWKRLSDHMPVIATFER